MACISAETGTLIFAIINIIIVTLGMAVNLGGVIYSIYNIMIYPSCSTTVIAVFIVMLLFTFMLITLVFSSLLLDGILKKKPGYVKAYFIYGVIVVLVTLLTLIGVCGAGVIRIFGPECIPIIISYGIYGSILYMIYCAYIKLKTVTGLYTPKPLIQNFA